MIDRLFLRKYCSRFVAFGILAALTCGCANRSLGPNIEFDEKQVQELRGEISNFEL